MKILLDECLPVRLRHSLTSHVVHSAEWAGFKGLVNGKLLDAAEREGYQVVITLDRGIPHQQRKRTISTIVLRSPENRLQLLLPLMELVDEIEYCR